MDEANRLRIGIHQPGREPASQIFSVVCDFLKRRGIRGEACCSIGVEGLLKRLGKDLSSFDILILDADCDDSLKLAGLVRSRNCVASLIFCSSSSQAAGRVIRYRPSALLNGIDPARIETALLYACGEQKRYHPYFPVKNKDGLVRVPYDDIVCFVSNQRLTTLCAGGRSISFYAKLSEVSAMLPEKQFIRCHQSYIVNLMQVERLDKAARCFIMRDGQNAAISRRYYPQIVEIYEDFMYGRK